MIVSGSEALEFASARLLRVAIAFAKQQHRAQLKTLNARSQSGYRRRFLAPLTRQKG